MTKKYLAENLLSALDNMDRKMTREEIVMAVFDVLEPKNLGAFAKWGNLQERSNPKDCWE